MSLWIKYDAEGLFFRPGAVVQDMAEAQAIADANNWKIYSINTQPQKAVGDGSSFKPHYNHGLGMHVETRKQYREQLKQRNLIEVGNERVQRQIAPKRPGYFSDEAVRGMNEMGAGLSDGDVKMLRDSDA